MGNTNDLTLRLYQNWDTLTRVTAIFQLVVFILGLVVNILLHTTIITNRPLFSKGRRRFIPNLVIADTVTIVQAICIILSSTLQGHFIDNSQQACDVSGLLTAIGLLVSFLTKFWMTFDWYLSIVWVRPCTWMFYSTVIFSNSVKQRVEMNDVWISVCSITTWIWSCLMTFMPFLAVTATIAETNIFTYCMNTWWLRTSGSLLSAGLNFATITFAFTGTVCGHILILRHVKKTQTRFGMMQKDVENSLGEWLKSRRKSVDEPSHLHSHLPAGQQGSNTRSPAPTAAETNAAPSRPTSLLNTQVVSSHQVVPSTGMQPNLTPQSDLPFVQPSSQQQQSSKVLPLGVGKRIQKTRQRSRRQSTTTETSSYTVFTKFRAMTLLSLSVLFPTAILNIVELFLGEEMPVEFTFVCTIVVSMYPLFNGNEFHVLQLLFQLELMSFTIDLLLIYTDVQIKNAIKKGVKTIMGIQLTLLSQASCMYRMILQNLNKIYSKAAPHQQVSKVDFRAV